jgi:heptosyltransferase-2
MHFLIIQTAFIGDIALAVFFAAELKLMFPESHITFVSTQIGCDLLKCFKFIDEVIVFDKRRKHKGLRGIKTLALQINARHYDYLFAIHRSLRTTLLARKINAKLKVGFNKSSCAFLYDVIIKYNSQQHEVERNRQMLAAFNENIPSFDYHKNVNFIKEHCITNVTLELPSNYEEYVIIAPGSVWATKRWLPNYFAELAAMLANAGRKVILVGSKNEETLCKQILTNAHQQHNIISLAGQTTLAELLLLVKNATLVITNDSSPTHFASLMNVRTITIYGATVPRFGFAPLADNSKCVENENLMCRPCGIHGQQRCPKKHFKCMNDLHPKEVFAECIAIL